MHAWQHAESFGTKYITFTLPHQGGIGEIKFIYCIGHKAGKYPNFQWFETLSAGYEQWIVSCCYKERTHSGHWLEEKKRTYFISLKRWRHLLPGQQELWKWLCPKNSILTPEWVIKTEREGGLFSSTSRVAAQNVRGDYAMSWCCLLLGKADHCSGMGFQDNAGGHMGIHARRERKGEEWGKWREDWQGDHTEGLPEFLLTLESAPHSPSAPCPGKPCSSLPCPPWLWPCPHQPWTRPLL